ncbi:MAG: hypothetical protein D6818_04500 [Bacteroidetes bacterium]|nr:MAG: hypothetical protein D6818_04500 [Bacteroidota bacterium]
MARRIRLTVFARLLLVLLILVPAAWFGAAWLNEEDPIDSLRRWLGQDEAVVMVEQDQPTPPAEEAVPQPGPAAPAIDVDSLQRANAALQKTIEELRDELRFKSRLVDELRHEVDSLKKRIWQLENE